MKKIFKIIVLVVSLFTANAIAFAEVTIKESRELCNVKMNMSPIIVKSLEGEVVEGGIHKFNNIASLDAFLKGTDEGGLRVTNSKKGKLNIVIMDRNEVGNLVSLADMANMTTMSRLEGPLYQIMEIPVETPKKIFGKLNFLGMKDPQILVVASGKKRMPGGIWKNIVSQVITIVTLI